MTAGPARRPLGLEDEEYHPLVIDWRAPAAAAFYQATAEEPMDVVRRRVIRSRGQRVLDVEDDLLDVSGAERPLPVVGDGALLAALARARGGHMRDIVATIQREQDRAIRAPAGGVTLIEGGPGTGKTAVALHRAAYLLYRDRRRFEGGGVLLVGPSSVFMSYVERVLPSLGEDTAELRSLGEVVDGVGSDRLDPPPWPRSGSGPWSGCCGGPFAKVRPTAERASQSVRRRGVAGPVASGIGDAGAAARLHHPNAAGRGAAGARGGGLGGRGPTTFWTPGASAGGGRPRRVRAVLRHVPIVARQALRGSATRPGPRAGAEAQRRRRGRLPPRGGGALRRDGAPLSTAARLLGSRRAHPSGAAGHGIDHAATRS